ncbi:aspartate aminotransferase family protein [Roseburia sp. BX0805]|uniref:Aspartate aminotransferase family protein n=1 Tax=Roseburia yibonii TaxID=2763063 RepID=A0ABR7IB56_9FIRM|nr:aspartate aminotransferase family protein [Roseburia yibonii]MBC5754175.1 aspartate aminotransferase family protein [Roseburia yibonii]
MTLEELKEEYATKNPSSKKAFDNACSDIPGGITANVKFFAPFPLFMKEGHGAWLTDLDDHKYVDYVLSYGPLILGHERKEVLDSIQDYFAKHGTMLYGTPHELEDIFAKKIKKHFPSIEMLRYTNSGTEATLLCIRTAFAYTGKYKLAKFEGHYHGGYNEVLVSVNPDVSKAGDPTHPTPLPESKGISDRMLDDTIVLPFNDLEACTEILTKHQDEVAAIIMEPLFSGTIPATKEFMTGIRALTKKLGILMIMDEVKTGFRITLGGAQQYYDVKPDLTALGKVIGAGFPVGIVGGRKDIMSMAAPQGSDILDNSNTRSAADILYHSGTYNGHPMILNAGLTTIGILEHEFDGLLKRTERLKNGIRDIYAAHGIHILTPGLGSMFNIAVTELSDIKTYRDLQKSDFALRKKLDYALLLEGIYNKPCNRYNMCTAHTDEVIDFTLEAYEKAFKRI